MTLRKHKVIMPLGFAILSTFLYLGIVKKNTGSNSGTQNRSASRPQVNTVPLPPKKNQVSPASVTDVQSLLTKLETLSFGNDYTELLSQIALYYRENDLDGGLEWLKSLENTPENAVAFHVIGSGFGSRGANELLAVPYFAGRGLFSMFLEGGLKALTRSSPADLLSTFEHLKGRLNSPDQVAGACAGLLATGGHFDIAWSLTKAVPSTKSHFFSGLVVENQDRALFYLNLIADQKERCSMIEECISSWPNEHLAQAGNFANNLKSDPGFDSAAYALSERTRCDNPSDAIAWSEVINDKKKRIQSIQRILNTTAGFDSEMALNLFKNLRSSPEEKLLISKGVEFNP
jgi:hypothetical protein